MINTSTVQLSSARDKEDEIKSPSQFFMYSNELHTKCFEQRSEKSSARCYSRSSKVGDKASLKLAHKSPDSDGSSSENYFEPSY